MLRDDDDGNGDDGNKKKTLDDEGGTRIDALLKLADSVWNEMDRRRSFEWKVNFGLWTALALLAGFMFRAEFNPSAWGRLFVVYVIGAITVVYISVWMLGLQRRSRVNIEAAYSMRRQVDRELRLGTGVFKPRRTHLATVDEIPVREALLNWSSGPQIFVTVMLALLVAYGVLSPPQAVTKREGTTAPAVQVTCPSPGLQTGLSEPSTAKKKASRSDGQQSRKRD